jgi:hypothetical protein
MSNDSYFNQKPNEFKRADHRKPRGIGAPDTSSILAPAPTAMMLEKISQQIQEGQRQSKADTYEHKNAYSDRETISVKTENSYFSSFAPHAAVPFAKDVVYLGLNGDNSKTEQYFDFFKVPDKRALFLTNLECRLAPFEVGGVVPTGPYRFTSFGGDDEFALYGLGFSLVANKTNSSFLAQTVIEDASIAATYTNTLPDVFGSYYVYNKNVLNNDTSPMYLTFIENLNVRALMQWRSFPTGLGALTNVESYAVLMRARGYLLNINDYYRFVDSVRPIDASSLKPII